MKYFLRPYRNRKSWVLAALLGTAFAGQAFAQSSGLAQVMETPSPLLHTGSTQGYMGVLVGDVDSESAAKLKLKDVRGAVVTLIDHDAPAAQAGVHVNDVVLQVNGQTVEGAEQFGRMMREIPAGHTVSLVISRDGAQQTIAVQLCDRKKMEHDVWNRLDNGNEPASSGTGLGILSGGGDIPSGAGGFHMPFVGTNTLSVGAMVEPLTSQMADYLGIQGGLMIKQIARKSEAEKAGLKAFDVILKVGPDGIATTADWDRALRANQNKAVQVTILRDRRQQTLNLQVDAKRHRSELEEMSPFGDDSAPLMALLDSDPGQELASELAAGDQLGAETFSIMPQQMEEFRKQAVQFAKGLQNQLNDQNFRIDPKQMEQFRKQAEQFEQNFKPEDFKSDPQLMNQLKDHSIIEFNGPGVESLQQEMQRQMDRLRRQFEEMQAQGFDHMV